MRALYLALVGLHLIAAIFWIGGMLFLALAVVPVMRRPAFRAISPAFFEAIGMRFRTLGWIAIGVLVLTGLIQLGVRGATPDRWFDPVFWQGPLGRALAGKLIAVVLAVGLNALHDFWAGPRATQALQGGASEAEAGRWRARASWLARLTLLASLLALGFGIFLARGWP